MNILPKKRWHVRTKENIARVRHDEAEFEQQQRRIEERSLLADQEARTAILRKRARIDESSASAMSKVTLLSDRATDVVVGNKEYEEEKRAEQEKGEKAIGLLTYLGQSVLDSGGKKPWYDTHPREHRKEEEDRLKVRDEFEARKKERADPLTMMRKVSDWFEQRKEEKHKQNMKEMERANSCISAMSSLFPKDILVPKSKSNQGTCSLSESIERIKADREHKKRKRHRNDADKTVSIDSVSPPVAQSTELSKSTGEKTLELIKQANVDRLRAERLQRERKERERAAVIMAKARGISFQNDSQDETVSTDERNLPYNSAFNPELSEALAERRERMRRSQR